MKVNKKLASLVYKVYRGKENGGYLVQLITHDAEHGAQFKAASKIEVIKTLEAIAERHAELIGALN